MKKLFFFSMAALFIFTACSKTERLDSGMLPDEMCKAYPAYSQVIVVPPDKDGDGDDTEELTEALSTATPGTLIKLLEGEYRVGYMELYDFHGSITGMGQEKTTVVMKSPLDQIVQNNDNKTAGWWRLIGGDITISDITFKTPDGFLSNPGQYNPDWGSDLYAMFMVNNYNDEYYHPDEPQKLLVSNCSFIGGTNPDMSKDGWWSTDHNTYIGIWAGMDYTWPKDGVDYPLTKGNYYIRDCKFEHFIDGAEGFSLGEEATMKVAGCKMNNCMWPLYFTANYNAKITISDNTFNNSWDFDIFIQDTEYGFLPNTTVKPGMRCIYNISGNRFNKSTVSSIKLQDDFLAIDPSHNLPMMITINNNLFNLTGTGEGITGLNSQDLVITRNVFMGKCSNGILIDGTSIFDATGNEYPAPFASNALIRGNNFTGLISTADIFLGEKSSICTVVGSGKETVVDNGVDNKIVAMHHKPGGHHRGPYYRDNFKTNPPFRHH